MIRTASFRNLSAGLALATTLVTPRPAAADTPAQGDFAGDAPGVQHRISPQDLPPPFQTKSVDNGPKVVKRPEGAQWKVPAGFEVREYASGFKNPRHLATAPNGDIFVAESSSGQIRVLRDEKGVGSASLNEAYASGLDEPFGLAFYPPGDNPQYLYIGDTDAVLRVPYHNGDLRAAGKPEKITELSPEGHLRGGGHWTRDVVFSADGATMYVSIGSKTNVDEDSDPIEKDRARIFVMKPDGSGKRPFATGIRNPVGLAIAPDTGELWTSVNERDGLGNDLVPDYITRVKDGQFYGWPWFYIGNHPDPRHAKDPHTELGPTVAVPEVLLQSHSASLNLVFYTGKNFPQAYQGNVFAAFHGSWNRQPRTGYKVIRVPVTDGHSEGYYEDFLTGFVLPDGTVWGRPVGLTVAKDGALLVSEDGNNTILRISATKTP